MTGEGVIVNCITAVVMLADSTWVATQTFAQLAFEGLQREADYFLFPLGYTRLAPAAIVDALPSIYLYSGPRFEGTCPVEVYICMLYHNIS